MTTREKWLNSVSGALVGAVALVLITAFFVGVAASIRANHQLDDAKVQREALSKQIDTLSKDNDSLRHEVSSLRKQNRRLVAQNQHLATQVSLLADFLRSQGLAVPKEAISGGGGSGGSVSGPSNRPRAQPVGPGHSGVHPCAHSRKC